MGGIMTENEQKRSEPKNERVVQPPKVITKAEIPLPAASQTTMQPPKIMTAAETKRENAMPPRKNIREL